MRYTSFAMAARAVLSCGGKDQSKAREVKNSESWKLSRESTNRARLVSIATKRKVQYGAWERGGGGEK
jgi:hypothetical protein